MCLTHRPPLPCPIYRRFRRLLDLIWKAPGEATEGLGLPEVHWIIGDAMPFPQRGASSMRAVCGSVVRQCVIIDMTVGIG